MATATADAKPRVKTSYVVFESKTLSEDGTSATPAWVEVGEAEGVNDIDAVKAIAAKLEVEAGTFVAVPARSFRVRNLSAQVKRTVSIS